jgi:uncharacterized Zn finger protein
MRSRSILAIALAVVAFDCGARGVDLTKPVPEYKVFGAPKTTAAACMDCGTVTEVQHEFGTGQNLLVTVQMDDGRQLHMRRSTLEGISVGTRVHVNEDRVRSM